MVARTWHEEPRATITGPSSVQALVPVPPSRKGMFLDPPSPPGPGTSPPAQEDGDQGAYGVALGAAAPTAG